MTNALTLHDFVETYFPGDRIPVRDGFAVTCPVCGTESALRIRSLYGTASVGCFTPDCSNDFPAALDLAPARREALRDSVTLDAPASGGKKDGGKDNDGRL